MGQIQIANGYLHVDRDFVSVKNQFGIVTEKVARSEVQTAIMRGRDTLVLIGAGTDLMTVHIQPILSSQILSWLLKELGRR